MDDSTADSAGPGLRPWRDLLATQIAVVWAFLQVTLDLDIAAGIAAARGLGAEPEVTLRVR
jgi:hypothetical protein